MSDLEPRAIAAFGSWLKSLGQDALTLDAVLGDVEAPEGVRRPLAGALNYLFKSLDLIDDGIEGLGFLDDAIVLRLSAAKAGPGAPEAVRLLAEDAALIVEFLGAMTPRFARLIDGLGQSTARGRSVDALLADASVREELSGDVAGWANRYRAPAFVLDDKGLVKLSAFLATKLPQV